MVEEILVKDMKKYILILKQIYRGNQPILGNYLQIYSFSNELLIENMDR